MGIAKNSGFVVVFHWHSHAPGFVPDSMRLWQFKRWPYRADAAVARTWPFTGQGKMYRVPG